MLYNLLKIPAAIAFWLYCRKLKVNDASYFNETGPLLIACNHPNSFLDAIIISSVFRRPVYSLARGDVFKNSFAAGILRSLKMLPVYRTTEGVENMEHNYSTFNACKEIFKENGIVLIFSEGRCINEWLLRPLMKGTARLALSSWQEGIPLRVLPTGINYQSFTSFGKNIHLNFGNIISNQSVLPSDSFGQAVLRFNEALKAELAPLVYEIAKNDLAKRKELMAVPVAVFTKIMLALPAFLGLLLHWPLCYPAKVAAKKYGGHNDHYDSILVCILFIGYPLYLLLIAVLLHPFVGNSSWAIAFLLLPLLGWCYLQIKKQF